MVSTGKDDIRETLSDGVFDSTLSQGNTQAEVKGKDAVLRSYSYTGNVCEIKESIVDAVFNMVGLL